MSKEHWTTACGQSLLPEQMSSGHIINALNMCLRSARKRMQRDALRAMLYANTAPDGAADAAETGAFELLADMDDVEEVRRNALRYYPITAKLEAEFIHRHMDPNTGGWRALDK